MSEVTDEESRIAAASDHARLAVLLFGIDERVARNDASALYSVAADRAEDSSFALEVQKVDPPLSPWDQQLLVRVPRARCIALSADGQQIVIGGALGHLFLCNLDGSNETVSFDIGHGPSAAVTAVCLVGSTLFVGRANGSLLRLSLADPTLPPDVLVPADPPGVAGRGVAALTRAGHQAVVGWLNGKVTAIDVTTGKIRLLYHPERVGRRVDHLLPHGESSVVVTFSTGEIAVLDLETEHQVADRPLHIGRVFAVATTEGGDVLASVRGRLCRLRVDGQSMRMSGDETFETNEFVTAISPIDAMSVAVRTISGEIHLLDLAKPGTGVRIDRGALRSTGPIAVVRGRLLIALDEPDRVWTIDISADRNTTAAQTLAITPARQTSHVRLSQGPTGAGRGATSAPLNEHQSVIVLDDGRVVLVEQLEDDTVRTTYLADLTTTEDRLLGAIFGETSAYSRSAAQIAVLSGNSCVILRDGRLHHVLVGASEPANELTRIVATRTTHQPLLVAAGSGHVLVSSGDGIVNLISIDQPDEPLHRLVLPQLLVARSMSVEPAGDVMLATITTESYTIFIRLHLDACQSPDRDSPRCDD